MLATKRAPRVHKFKVGQRVTFRPPSPRLSGKAVGRDGRNEEYEIVQLLPETGTEFQYRIKGGAKGQERVVIEGEIDEMDEMEESAS